MNQGRRAQKSGKTAEKVISCILKENAIHYESNYNICDSIYGHPIKVDFYLQNVTKYPDGIAIECKWQDVKGSVDEKFPYLVLNIKEKFPCPAIIVLDGKGQKPGSINWLKQQVDDKLVAVYSLNEFLSSVLRELNP